MRGPIRVLVVDDDLEFVTLTADALERACDEITAVTETRPAAGLERLADAQIDCIVSDYQMPCMDGLAFFEAVREEHPTVPFILFTRKGSEAIASKAVSAGITDYLQKGTGTSQYAILANRIKNSVTQYQAEKDAQETRQRFQRLIEASTDVIMVVDADGNVEYLSPAAERILGYEPDVLVGENGFEYIHPEDREEAMEEFAEMVENPEYHPSVEFRFEQPDGEWVWLENRGHNLLGDPVIEGIVVYSRDITEQKRKERGLEELVEQREEARIRYRTLFENNPIAIWVEDCSAAKRYVDSLAEQVDDLDTYLDEHPQELNRIVEQIEVIDVNQQAVEYYAADSKTDLIENLDRIMTQESKEAVKAMWIAIAAGETTFRTETSSKTFDGKRRHEIMELNVPAASEDDYSHVYLSVTDITERKEREQTINQLYESTQELITADSRQEVARAVAEAARDLLGFAFPVVRFLEGERLEPAYAVPELEAVADSIPTYEVGESLAGGAFSAGEPKIYQDLQDLEDSYDRGVTRSAMYVPIGDHGVLSVGDETPGAFSDLDLTFIEILARNAETALDIIDQRQSLQRQNERLDKFAGAVSHDLRNPLNVATGRAELAQSECDSEHLDTVVEALGRMKTIIEDTLTLARQGQAESETERMDLSAVATGCWGRVMTADASMKLVDEVAFEGDPDGVARIFENLFRNAVDHGGDSVTVRVGALGGNGFFVADDGPGIPEAEREAVFDRGHSTSEDGTGFGLAIVREITDAHGWDVAVTESNAGGARFEITDVDVH